MEKADELLFESAGFRASLACQRAISAALAERPDAVDAWREETIARIREEHGLPVISPQP